MWGLMAQGVKCAGADQTSLVAPTQSYINDLITAHTLITLPIHKVRSAILLGYCASGAGLLSFNLKSQQYGLAVV